METILLTFRSRNWEKTHRLELKFFTCNNINMELLWLILNWYTILEDFFLLDSVRYHNDAKMTLKSDWSNLKILISGWYRKFTSSCVLVIIYQQGHGDIEVNATPKLSWYQDVHWESARIEVSPSKDTIVDAPFCWL